MELLLFTPLAVLLISLAQRLLGDRAGGRVAALPLTSTAVIAIVATDQGTTAASAVAKGIATGAPLGAAIVATYAWLAGRKPRPARKSRHGQPASRHSGPPMHHGRPTVHPMHQRRPSVHVDRPSGRGGSAAELLVRVLVVTGCVAGVSAAAHVLPPQVAGVVAAFPVLALVLATMTRRRAGASAARDLVRGVLAGTPAGLAFVVTLACVLGPLPLALAFAVAAVAWSAGQ
jgi:hypothetical protein